MKTDHWIKCAALLLVGAVLGLANSMACEQSPGKISISVSGAEAGDEDNYYVVMIPEEGKNTVTITGSGQTPCPTDEEKCKCEDQSKNPEEDGDPKFTFSKTVGDQDPTDGPTVKWEVDSSTTPGEYKFKVTKIEQAYKACPQGWTGGVASKSNTQESDEVTVAAVKLAFTDFSLCEGAAALTITALPQTVAGQLVIKVKTSKSTYTLFDASQEGGLDLKPQRDWKKLPDEDVKITLQKIIMTWKVGGVLATAPEYTISGTSVGLMECTGYFTTRDSAYSGTIGEMWEGATSIPVHQSFLDANVIVRNGNALVLEGVGVLTEGASTYYHFRQSDQVVQNGVITRYVVYSNNQDGWCGGPVMLQKNRSVAKRNSSSFFSCGSSIFIEGLSGEPCFTVEDNGHDIDTPDVFNGQGNSSLDIGYGKKQVVINE